MVIGDNDAPLAVGPSDDADRNIIVWMDHRATGQAEKINATGHPVLRYVGGKISPEMQTPKNFVAEGESPAHLSAGAPLLRPRRLPHLALNRR
ncbi:D-ribulokinase [Klebsiella pneumoniae IS53]|nr:D-ribulokinase [Klebsiella pneumoniae IS53]